MDKLEFQIQQLMLWEVKNNKISTEPVKKIGNVYGYILTDRQVSISKFCSIDTSLSDELRLGCSSNLHQYALSE